MGTSPSQRSTHVPVVRRRASTTSRRGRPLYGPAPPPRCSGSVADRGQVRADASQSPKGPSPPHQATSTTATATFAYSWRHSYPVCFPPGIELWDWNRHQNFRHPFRCCRPLQPGPAVAELCTCMIGVENRN